MRSARETDLELLRQFDRPTLAFSGAQGRLLPVIDRAPLDAVPPSKAPGAYVRGPDRPAPHNLYLRPKAKIPFEATGVDAVEALGLERGAAPSGGGARGQPYGALSVGVRDVHLVLRARPLAGLAGRVPCPDERGRAARGQTVVVQDVTVRPSDFRDRSGNVSPFTETVGSGDAVVLRDGRVYDVRWSRPSADADTAYTAPDGRRVDLADGPLWILYAPREGSATAR